MERYRAGECPCCGHHNNWDNTLGPHAVTDDDNDDSDSDESSFNPVFDDDSIFDPNHNYLDDDDNDDNHNAPAITV